MKKIDERVLSLKYLSKEEAKMANIIWNTASREHYDGWFKTLSNKDKVVAKRMLTMITTEIEFNNFEEKVENSDFEESIEVLRKAMKK